MIDKYSVNVFWSEDDGCFVATCPEFSLLSAFGDTREEATSEFQTALELAIESYQEDGLELPKPKTATHHSGQLRLRLPKSMHKNLAETAEREGVSLNTYIVSLVSESYGGQKILRETTDALEKVATVLNSHVVIQQNALQVYSRTIDLLENQHRPKDKKKGSVVTKEDIVQSAWYSTSQGLTQTIKPH